MTADQLSRIISKNIRSRRIELGITQKALAESLGTSQSYVSQLETGRENLSIQSLAKIADLLRIQPDLLLRQETFLEVPA